MAKTPLNMLPNKGVEEYLLIVVAILLFGFGWWLKQQSVVLAIVLSYLAIMMLLLPFCHIKFVRWIFTVLYFPLVLLIPTIQRLVITILGIFFPVVCINVLVRLYECVSVGVVNNTLTLYLSTTLAFVLATQMWYKNVVNKIINSYHSKYKGMGYQPNLAKFLIYVFYLVALLVSYVMKFLDMGMASENTTVFLASFATFVAYDRLISNKKLLEESQILKLYEMKDAILDEDNSSLKS